VREVRVCCRLLLVFVLSLFLGSAYSEPGKANSRSFKLGAPDALVATGFLKHLLPRFSLKTGIRIELVEEIADADARFSMAGRGTPVFSGGGDDWYLEVQSTRNEHLSRFEDWITGDIGRKTIEGFRSDGKVLFTAAVARPKAAETVALAGDAIRGEQLAVSHCGRCHMVNEATRLTTIGSTPSFAIMRSFSDWQDRFEAFFSLNPHPSFTMIEGVTEPFDVSRPPPIVPLELTLNELDAILAFVSRIPPADLGAPIQYQ
jgi:hypothetical protein